SRNATIQMEKAKIKYAFLNKDEKQYFSEDDDASALMAFHTKLEMRDVELLDSSTAIFIGERSELQAENIIIGGRIYARQSIAKMTAFQVHKSEEVALPIRLTNYAQVEIDFINPDANILLNKEKSSLF